MNEEVRLFWRRRTSRSEHHDNRESVGGPMTHIFRGFWHGRPLSSYELVCLRSVVAHGHRFELFTYDREILVPNWISRRDAQEIFPTDHVMVYHTGLGAGSPALHSDVFRYEMMYRLGGWWLDLDVLLLRSDPPSDDELFLACDVRRTMITAVLKFPCSHPLLAEAIKRSKSVDEKTVSWTKQDPP